jgi:hypothetical protein
MSFNLDTPKPKVITSVAVIVLVVILVLTANFIKSKVVANKIRENIEQGSDNLDLENVNEEKKDFELAISIQKENKETVKANPIVKTKQIGYISKVYEEGGKKYLRFDDVKFLMGNEAIEAAKKDGAAIYENGEYFVYDDYYIVNNSEKAKNYVIADIASLNLLGFWIDSLNGDGNNHSVSYNKFKSISSENEHMLCYIYAENNVVVKIEGQYTP